jgi:hypothetical protein
MADIEIRQASPTAFYIKVHDTDNVAILSRQWLKSWHPLSGWPGAD